MTQPESTPSPSLLRRLVAMLYDTLLVIALVGVVNALALGLAVKLTAGELQVLDANIVRALTAISIVGFYTLFWRVNGQTLGMQAWRIKLVDFHGRPPSVSRSILRCCGAAISAACLGLGYLWCLFDRNGRYWHDYLSGTELILLPKPEKASRS